MSRSSTPARLRCSPAGAFSKGETVDCFSCWSPDGRRLAGIANQPSSNTSADGASNWTIPTLDPATLETALEISAEPCYCVDFTPDGRYLCTGATDGALRTYDLEAGSLVSRIAVNDVGIRPIIFSPDGTHRATVGREGGDVVVWSTTVSPYDRVARFHQDGYASAAAWDATGTRLATAHDKTVRIWDARPLRERVAAREARRQAMARVEPMVVALVAELKDRAAVAERLKADPELDELERRTALQALLRLGLDAPGSPPAPARGPISAPTPAASCR